MATFTPSFPGLGNGQWDNYSPDTSAAAAGPMYWGQAGQAQDANILRNSNGVSYSGNDLGASQNFQMPQAGGLYPYGGGNSYGGFGNTQAYGGSEMTGLLQQNANRAAYQRAYQQAQQQNLARYNEVGGFNQPGLGLQTRKNPQTGKPEININGQWVDQSQANPHDIYNEVGHNSYAAPLEGGYYGREARADQQLQAMGSTSDFYNNRTNQGLGYLNGMNGVAQQYAQRTQNGVNMAGNAFWQARNDVNRQFDNLQGSAANNLTQRGLTNSTISDSVRSSVEADRAQAQGRLSDQLSQAQSGAYNQLSGQQLAYAGQIPQAQEQAYSQLSGQQGQWLQNYGQTQLETGLQTSKDLLNHAASLNIPYPNASIYQQANQQNADAARSQQQYQLQLRQLQDQENYYGLR